MPKETFFNLPEEKRTHITNIAIDEFGNHDYRDVSISRMVARAGIAKGSFYQYFEDKEDLYTYLLDLAVQKKWEFLNLDHPDPEHVGVFRYLHSIAKAGVEMQLAYPELLKVAARAFMSKNFPPEFFARAQEDSRKYFLHLVAIGKAQGDIPEEIDDELAAFIFNSTLLNLGQYLTSRIQHEPEYLDGKRAFFEFPEAVRLFDQTLNILEFGMGKRHTEHVSAETGHEVQQAIAQAEVAQAEVAQAEVVQTEVLEAAVSGTAVSETEVAELEEV
jgi:TetR/AcrR family transcriptional regulator